MREILFRGKRIDTGEWVYGYVAIHTIIGEETELKTVIVQKPDKIYQYDSWIVDPETVGQDTGLKDKNGKEIYEGDIIEKIYYSYHQPECSEIFKIIYNGLGFSFEHIKGRSYHTPFTEEIEVIGNIHENIELLEKKQWKKLDWSDEE